MEKNEKPARNAPEFGEVGCDVGVVYVSEAARLVWITADVIATPGTPPAEFPTPNLLLAKRIRKTATGYVIDLEEPKMGYERFEILAANVTYTLPPPRAKSE